MLGRPVFGDRDNDNNQSRQAGLFDPPLSPQIAADRAFVQTRELASIPGFVR